MAGSSQKPIRILAFDSISDGDIEHDELNEALGYTGNQRLGTIQKVYKLFHLERQEVWLIGRPQIEEARGKC